MVIKTKPLNNSHNKSLSLLPFISWKIEIPLQYLKLSKPNLCYFILLKSSGSSLGKYIFRTVHGLISLWFMLCTVCWKAKNQRKIITQFWFPQVFFLIQALLDLQEWTCETLVISDYDINSLGSKCIYYWTEIQYHKNH